ncbi:MAG: hypothetical protein NZL87_01415 [Thermomicrobium sp.]|nr:hypothetical protein [Thermomicrobium sp.]
MAITLYTTAPLANAGGSATSAWSQSNVNLPAGRLLMMIGTEFDTTYRTVSGISHPAIVSAQRLGNPVQQFRGSVYENLELWEVQSSGGTGTLTISFSGTTNFYGLITALITDAGPVIDVATASGKDWVSTFAATPNGSGATHGFAACFGQGSLSGATLTISPWNDAQHQVNPSSWVRMRAATRVGTNLGGQTQTFGVSGGTWAVGVGIAAIFPDATPQGVVGPLFAKRRFA